MVPSQNDFLGSGLSYDELVEFSPNEPGIPFGDNSVNQVNTICHQNPANIPVVDFNTLEVMEQGGELIYLDDFAFFRVASK